MRLSQKLLGITFEVILTVLLVALEQAGSIRETFAKWQLCYLHILLSLYYFKAKLRSRVRGIFLSHKVLETSRGGSTHAQNSTMSACMDGHFKSYSYRQAVCPSKTFRKPNTEISSHDIYIGLHCSYYSFMKRFLSMPSDLCVLSAPFSQQPYEEDHHYSCFYRWGAEFER